MNLPEDCLHLSCSDAQKHFQVRLDLREIAFAVKRFRHHTGILPRRLRALLDDPDIPGWKGPYLDDEDELEDPWQGAYGYEPAPATGAFILRSSVICLEVDASGEERELTPDSDDDGAPRGLPHLAA